MNSTRAALIGIVSLVLMGLVFLAMSGGNTGPDIDALTIDAPEVPEVVVASRPKPRSPIQLAAKGPDGTTVQPTGKEVRAEGLPKRADAGIEGGPLDEDTWEKRHIEMDMKWHNGMTQGTEAWANNHNLNSGDRNELLNTVAGFTKSVIQIREDVRAGELKLKESRQRTLDLRAQIHEDVSNIVGEERADDLSHFLGTQTVGGGW